MKNVLVLGLAALLLFAGGSTWLALYPSVPPDLGGVANLDALAERVRLPVGEDDHLDGWLLPGTKRALVVLFAGYARDHHRMWRHADALRRQGYAVLAVDFRSARALGRKPTTLGFWELLDARATLDWVGSEPRFDGWPLALFGESLGGSVALALAAERPALRAVIVDCPFANGGLAIEDGFRCVLKLPSWPLAPIARGLARVITHHDPAALDAAGALRRLDGRPVLLIQTTREDRFSRRQVRALHEAAGRSVESWTLDDVDHTGAWPAHRAEYERRLQRFLSRHLPAGAVGAHAVGRAIAKPLPRSTSK